MKTEVVLKFHEANLNQNGWMFNENRSCIEIKQIVCSEYNQYCLMKTEVVLKWT